jgi:hypothetical protein
MATLLGQDVAFAQTNVAKIKIEETEYEYSTLAEAVDAVPANGTETTITLIGNAANTDPLNITFGKNVVLDLQGHSVSRSLNAAADDGHVIKVVSGAKLTVQDTSEGAAGTITGGNTKGTGGGIYNDGTFILKSGAIMGNKAAYRAGGIFSSASATLTIEGGKISNNTSAIRGGGIYIEGGNNNIADCTIEGNKATANENTDRFGAGIYVEGGTVKISNCTIQNNEGRNQGGGIYVNAGEVTVTNTKITGNKSWANATGAGVYLNGGTLTIDGCEITGNIGTKAEYKGVGLYYGGGTLQMKGVVNITGNHHTSSPDKISNVYLPTGKKITVIGSLEGSTIGVTLGATTGTGVITEGLPGNGDASCFSNDNNDPKYYLDLNYDHEAEIHLDYVCKNTTTGVRYETLKAAVDAVNDGEENTITPLKDIILSAGLVIPANKNIVLDLQGYTLSRSLTEATNNGYVIKVAGGATVTIQDTSEGEKGKITGGWNNSQGGGIYNEGTLTLKDITVTGNKSTGGQTGDCYGGGIYSHRNSTIIIDGVQIIGNEAEIKGGGIHIASLGENNVIKDCLIQGNKTIAETDGIGAGLYIQRGTVNITGCTITENEANGNGGGMFIGNDNDIPVVNIANTIITGNTSTGEGSGFYYNRGKLNIEGNEVEIYGSFKVAKPTNEATSANGVAINGGYFEDFDIKDWEERVNKNKNNGKIKISGGTYVANNGFITADRYIDNFCVEEYCACDHRQAKDRPETWTVRWLVPELKADGSYAGFSRTEDKEVTSAYYTRKFSEKVTNNYQCWFVPFDYVVTEEENEDGWEFYEITTASGLGKNTLIGINKLEVGDLLEANKPYVVKPAKVETHGFASPYAKTLKAYDGSAVINLEDGSNNFGFYGVYQRTYATTKDEWMTVSVKGTSFWAVPGDDVKPFRWIIKVTDAATGAPAKVDFTFVETEGSDSEATGIRDAEPNTGANLEVEGIYTVNGVKTEHLRKGLNIIKMKEAKTKVVIVK